MQAGLALHVGRQPKANRRFVVTNVGVSVRRIYQRIYCQGGEVENRIKELKAEVEMDRASCTSFYANQFRVLLSATAYSLLQELRCRFQETGFARTQVEGQRLSLLNFWVWVRSSRRRVVLSMSRQAPCLSEWLQIARSLGTAPTWGTGGGSTVAGGKQRGGSVLDEGRPSAGRDFPTPLQTDHGPEGRPSTPVFCRNVPPDRKTGQKTI